jgi:hypothetical protein
MGRMLRFGLRLVSDARYGYDLGYRLTTRKVTHQLAQPGWIRRTQNEVVFLKNIQQFSFSSRFDSTLVDDFELVFADARGILIPSSFSLYFPALDHG